MKDNKITIKNLSDRITEDDCKLMCEKFGVVYKTNIFRPYGQSGECDITFTIIKPRLMQYYH